ncbi:GPO family capsid scaffolding protein [Atlantibacter hermannii]|uniref:GPO family capsid scaffolding protein n=1 Tax=Atlantibacter hermannii TaxID=565 RepID=UPI00290691C5|nr:GPO family capsid scaffolding protein [Atlantibacter hermannii]MDU7390265.1 GPO family capsid scaffolding protein [Atlantibacter hermannii]
MAKKAKRFRVGVEGATTDGRNIERDWLTQMAANYDPQVYTALINVEHIKGFTPDSPFRRFGKVDRLEAEEITEGKLAGKMALYAWITPTDDLVDMTGKMQKLFTSMEVSVSFADSGEAYLVGLAVTDDPASLGTEMLQFSAGAAHSPLASRKLDAANLFTAAEETLIEFEDETEKPNLFTRVKELLTRKSADDKAKFADVHQAVEAVAQEHQTLSAIVDGIGTAQTAFSARLDEMQQVIESGRAELVSLREKLSAEDSRSDRRPTGTGGNGSAEQLTNC